MASSTLGLDLEYFFGLLVDHYRATDVYYPGSSFSEPKQSASGSTPVDWITADVLRSESEAFNVENAQARDVRIVIYGAFQPNRAGLIGRIDTIHADLADALNLDRSANSQTFTDGFDFIGDSAPPPGMTTKQPWLWRAWFTDLRSYRQVA